MTDGALKLRACGSPTASDGQEMLFRLAPVTTAKMQFRPCLQDDRQQTSIVQRHRLLLRGLQVIFGSGPIPLRQSDGSQVQIKPAQCKAHTVATCAFNALLCVPTRFLHLTQCLVDDSEALLA